MWGPIERGRSRLRRPLRAEYLHPFADPLVVAGQGNRRTRNPRTNARRRHHPRRHRRRRADRGNPDCGEGAQAGCPYRRHRTDRIAHPARQPRRQREYQAASRDDKVATMACRQTDQRIYDIVREKVDDIVLITDEAMEAAARRLWFETGLAADLSGAALHRSAGRTPATLLGIAADLRPGLRRRTGGSSLAPSSAPVPPPAPVIVS